MVKKGLVCRVFQSHSITYATVFALIASMLVPATAQAASLTQALVRFDRMKISQATTGTVCAKPATALVEASVQVTFPAGYTVNTTFTNWTVSTTNTGWPIGATAWLGIGTATAAVGQIVTFPSTDLVVGTLYCFNWTAITAVSVKSSATPNNSGTITTRDAVPTPIDTASFSSASIADDQIVVSASVAQTFSFALSANTDGIGSLATGIVNSSPTPRTATVNTNAKNGWYVWAKDSSTGLSSASASSTIASTTPGSNSTLSAGTEGYNSGITQTQTSGTGVLTVAAPFVGGLTGKGGGLNTSLATIVLSTGTANNAVLTLTNNVAIGSTTPAASDYTDTVTVVGAGLF